MITICSSPLYMCIRSSPLCMIRTHWSLLTTSHPHVKSEMSSMTNVEQQDPQHYLLSFLSTLFENFTVDEMAVKSENHILTSSKGNHT